MRFPRSSGILLHPTSFPSDFGIGDLGPTAYAFLDFAADSAQSLWQVMPLGPTGYGDSPYQSFSAFAGNPLLVSPQALVASGLLPTSALDDHPAFPAERVDYGAVITYKSALFDHAFAHFEAQADSLQQADFEAFCEAHSHWLDDFSLFMALKKRHDGAVWVDWETDIATRQPEALAYWREELAHPIRKEKYKQFLFFQQWTALKGHANGQGIQIIGDIPIFCAYDSVDVWANRDLFFLDDSGRPTHVAGVPPDYFSPTGQLWGNPLYRWEQMARNGFAWWIERFRMILQLVDIVRLDHFRGFEAYWEVPAGEETAVNGRWVKGPGEDLFYAVKDVLGALPIIAEDLGLITAKVEALRLQFELPGMKVLQFAFSGDPAHKYLPHNYAPNCVVYTGTHDNNTTVGWFANREEKEREQILSYLARDGHDIAWDLVRLAASSVADTAIYPLQDILRLGSDARMNTPGQAGGNWAWRYVQDALTDELKSHLAKMTQIYGRAPKGKQDEKATPQANDGAR